MIATARRLLQRGAAELGDAGVRDARFEAELLLRHAMGCSREWLFARLNEPVAPGASGYFFQLVERRRGRVPIQHLLGEQEFYGLSMRVTPAVLIPRPETEGVVEEALAELEGRDGPRVADVGCGSGCISVALAIHLAGAVITAIDASPAALAVARENAELHGVSERVTFVVSDLLEPVVEPGSLDAVVSNPPYIPDAELAGLEPEVAEHEPREALSGGGDGFLVISRLLPQARRALGKGGVLVMEIGHGQDERIAELVAREGLELLRIATDLAGIPRVVVARA